MFGTLRSIVLSSLVALATLPAAALAASQDLSYTVVREGKVVGSHKLSFSTAADGAEQVAIVTNVAVKIAFITVYRFEHEGAERWQGGALVGLTSKTNDDGTPNELSVKAEGGELKVIGNGKASTMPLGTIPASLWNPAIVKQKTILNTLDGHPMNVTFADKGVETVTVKGAPVQATHYVMEGDLKRELWFDAEGVLVKLRFRGKDDSEIVYELR